MIETEHNEQLGIPTLRLVVAYVAQMKRFIQPKTKHWALYNHLLLDGILLVS